MTELIIPIKPLHAAKQRLADVLTRDQRADLVLAMLQDLLENVSRLTVVNTWVISQDQRVLELTKRYGCREIKEPTVAGYNSALEFALRYVKEFYGKSVPVAFIPADLPLTTVSDLSKLIRPAAPGESVIRLAPSHDERGTNGVFLSSDGLLSPSFGENSFQRYCKLCQAAGIVPEILFQSSLAQDIDTPDDLAHLRYSDHQGATFDYLKTLTGDRIAYAVQ